MKSVFIDKNCVVLFSILKGKILTILPYKNREIKRQLEIQKLH